MKKKIALLIVVMLIQESIASFAQTISGGAYHCLALCSDSTLQVWGNNSAGQLGIGSYTLYNIPVQVSAFSS
ncbi:MAG: hypothetical protein JJE25_15290, partial [Bacteroidia bacterium]|nr:hypothetical protein [Bacteroidia bacterium]